MGKIAEVQAFERDGTVETVRVDPAGGANTTVAHAMAPGDDSPPLPGDFAEIEDSAGAGRAAAVGYTDPTNERQAEPGEKRFYARDADGNIVATFWMKNDGSIRLYNDNATILVDPDGIASVQAPDVRLGLTGGTPAARRGEPVVTVTPQLLSAAPGSPCVPVPPTALTPTGNYTGTGVVLSGSPTVKVD